MNTHPFSLRLLSIQHPICETTSAMLPDTILYAQAIYNGFKLSFTKFYSTGAVIPSTAVSSNSCKSVPSGLPDARICPNVSAGDQKFAPTRCGVA